MNATDPRTSFVVEMAREVIAEHTARGHCTEDDPCYIVESHLVNLDAAEAGRRESQFEAPAGYNGHRPAGGAKAGNQYGPAVVKYATAKQVAYIGRLLKTRDRSGLAPLALDLVEKADEAFHTGRISKRLSSDALDILVPLKDRPSVAAAAPTASTRRANKYAGKCVTCGGWVAAEAGYLTKDAAGKWASEHKDGEHVTAAPAAPAVEVEAGMYYVGTQIFRAYLGQQSGKILCKEVVEVEGGEYELEYRGLAERFIKGADVRRMTLDEAKAWGRTTGTCCVCARRLDVPESVDAGIGPKCAGRFA